MGAGQDTVISVVVNEPGKNNAVSKIIVEDALYQTIQENNRTTITNLQLAIVNALTISDTERENSLRVRLHDTQAADVSISLTKSRLYLGLFNISLRRSYAAFRKYSLENSEQHEYYNGAANYTTCT